jgi:phage shock protein PspC (stress-responsive transcriptional regulator)
MDTTAPDNSNSEPAAGTAGAGSPPATTLAGDRLHRPRAHRMVAGVAAGMADYFDIDPMLVRMGFVVLTLIGGLALPLYLAGWLLIPEEGADYSVAEELLARERAR